MVDVVGRAKVIVEGAIDQASFGAEGSKIGGILKKGALAGVAALGGLAVVATKSALAFEESERVGRKLTTVLGNMGKQDAAPAVEALANSLQRTTGVSDEVIRGGQTILATFSQLAASAGEVGGNFDRATRASVDLAAAGFGNVESASVMLGKALQDPVKGVSALGEAGVTFSEDQKAMIEALVQTGDVAAAQNIILAEVEKQVKGTAESGATMSERLKTATGEVLESFGHLLSEATDGKLKNLPDAVFALADAMDDLANSPTWETIGTNLTNFAKDAKDAYEWLDKFIHLNEQAPAGVNSTANSTADRPVEPELNILTATPEELADQSDFESIKQSFLVWFNDPNNALTTDTFGAWIDTGFQNLSQAFRDKFTGGETVDLGGAIKEWFMGVWDDADWAGTWESIKTRFNEDVDATVLSWKTYFGTVFDDFKTSVKKEFDDFVDDVQAIPGKIKNKANEWYDAGKLLLDRFWDGLKSNVSGTLGDIAQKIKDAINKALPNSITFFGGKGGVPAITIPVPQFAQGGRAPGGLAWVGERGPELLNLPRNTEIYSNRESREMVAAAGMGDLTLVQNFYGTANPAEMRKEVDIALKYGSRFGSMVEEPA